MAGGRLDEDGRADPGEAEPALPLYRAIARTIQAEIAQERYPVGSSLPSENALMERFGVSRYTIRAALSVVQESGRVRPQQGRGSIVQARPAGSDYVHRISTIGDLFPVDAETRLDPLDKRLVGLPARASCFAGLDPAAGWLRISGERCKPGAKAPFNELEIFVAARFAGIGALIGRGKPSIHAMLETVYGEVIGEVEQVIGGFAADGLLGARIGLRSGQVGIEVRRSHRVASDGDIGIVSFNRYPVEEYSFSMVLRRLPPGSQED